MNGPSLLVNLQVRILASGTSCLREVSYIVRNKQQGAFLRVRSYFAQGKTSAMGRGRILGSAAPICPTTLLGQSRDSYNMRLSVDTALKLSDAHHPSGKAPTLAGIKAMDAFLQRMRGVGT